MDINIALTLTPDQQKAVERVIAKMPAVVVGDVEQPKPTVQEYLTTRLQEVLDSYDAQRKDARRQQAIENFYKKPQAEQDALITALGVTE